MDVEVVVGDVSAASVALAVESTTALASGSSSDPL